jgi:hypothetical protein
VPSDGNGLAQLPNLARVAQILCLVCLILQAGNDVHVALIERLCQIDKKQHQSQRKRHATYEQTRYHRSTMKNKCPRLLHRSSDATSQGAPTHLTRHHENWTPRSKHFHLTNPHAHQKLDVGWTMENGMIEKVCACGKKIGILGGGSIAFHGLVRME